MLFLNYEFYCVDIFTRIVENFFNSLSLSLLLNFPNQSISSFRDFRHNVTLFSLCTDMPKTNNNNNNNNNNKHLGSSCCGQLCDLFRPRPGFDPLCARLSPPRCLTCSWACRMSSGPWGIVVVRVS